MASSDKRPLEPKPKPAAAKKSARRPKPDNRSPAARAVSALLADVTRDADRRAPAKPKSSPSKNPPARAPARKPPASARTPAPRKQPAPKKKPAPSAPAPPPPRHPPAAEPLRVLFGLTVIWGCLCLVDWAQSISYRADAILTPLRPAPSAQAPPWTSESDPLAQALRTVEEFTTRRLSAQRIVASLLLAGGLKIEESGLEAFVAPGKRAADLRGLALYSAVHRIIGDTGVGLSLAPGHASLFRQSLRDTEPAQGDLTRFQWSADLDLSTGARIIFPSARTDVWIRLVPSAAGAASPGVLAEIGRGQRSLVSGALNPDADSTDTLDQTSGNAVIRLMIRGLPAEEGSREPSLQRVRVVLYYETGASPPAPAP